MRGTSLIDATPRHDYTLVVDEFRVNYKVDITRDINAVGLIYFARLFLDVDWAILKAGGTVGRSDESFLTRVVVDQKICYVGNANVDSVFTIKVKLWKRVGHSGYEVFDVVIRKDRDTERMIAICTVHTLFSHRRDGIN